MNRRHLYYWAEKFREEDAPPASQAGWVQLEAVESPVSDGAFEVRIGSATVVVKPGFDPEAFASIVGVPIFSLLVRLLQSRAGQDQDTRVGPQRLPAVLPSP